MKPMLEFTCFPPAAQGKPRRRRMKLKSPRNPRVRYVALTGLLNQPIRHESDQPDNIDFQLAMKGAKWVSPQFPEEPMRAKPSVNGRKGRPHCVLHLKGQLFPEEHRTNLRSDKGFGARQGGGCARTRPWRNQCDRTEENVEWGCARTRVWTTHRGLTHSQDISLFASMYPDPLRTSPEEGSARRIRVEGDISAVTSNISELQEHVEVERRPLLAEGQGREDFLPLCSRGQDTGTSGEGREDFLPLHRQGRGIGAAGINMDGRDSHREGARLSENSLAGGREEFLCSQGQEMGTSRSNLEGGDESYNRRLDARLSENNLAGFLPLCSRGQDTGISESSLAGGREDFNSSSHSNIDNVSSLLSSMSIDDTNAPVRKDSTHVSDDTGSTHLSGDADPAHLSGDTDSTHLSGDTDSTHLSGSAHLSGDTDSTHLSGDAGSAHLSGDTDSTHLSGDAGPAHLSGDTDSTHLSGDTDSTHLSEDTGPAHLSGDTDSTHLSGDAGSIRTSDSTHLSRDGHVEVPNEPLEEYPGGILASVKGADTVKGAVDPGSQQGNLEGYVDEFGSDTAEFPLCNAQSTCVTDRVKSGRERELSDQIGEGRLFQPPSFSTPFRNGVSSRTGCTTEGEWRNFARLDASSSGSRSNFAARLESSCVQPRSLSSKLDSSKWRSPGVMECDPSGSTRLESFWGKVHSPMDIGTPGCAIPCVQTSAKKSILKKRHLYWNTSQTPNDRRNLSKSVTFKLPSDSDGSTVLAVETPEHLWCAPLGWNGTETESMVTTDCIQGKGGALSCVTTTTEGCTTLSMEGSLRNKAALPCVTVTTECCTGLCSSMERSFTAGLSTEHTLGYQAPHGLRDLIPACALDYTDDSCDDSYMHKYDCDDDSCQSVVHTRCLLTSPQNSESSELEDMSVLAVETPTEYWESVPINFIDNTY